MPEIIRKYKDKSKIFLKDKFKDDGAGWLMLQQMLTAPLSIITTILLTGILSLENYGYYKYIISIYGVISIFSFSGIYSITQLNIQRGQDYFFSLAFKYKKTLRWIPSIISLFVALYYFYNQNNFLAIFFLINIFSYLIVDTYDFYLIVLQGKGLFKKNMFFAVSYYFVSYFPPIITAFLTSDSKYSLYYIFITMYLCMGIFRIISFKYLKRKLNLNINDKDNISKKDIKEFNKESLSVSLTGAIGNASINASSVVVFNRLGAEANAVYSIALTFADFVMGIIAASLGKVLLILSRISKEKGYTLESDEEKINLISTLFKKYFWLAVVGVVATASTLPFIYKFLFPKYYFSYEYAVIYSISILAVSLLPAYYYLYEKRKFKLINTIQIINLILNLILLFFASMYFGVLGAIIVAIIMRFIYNGVFYIVTFYNKT